VFQHTNVSSEPSIKSAVERAAEEYGRLDIMFNNAGLVGAIGPIEAVGAEDWDRSIALLLRSVFLGIKYAVEPMRKDGGGSIVDRIISSITLWCCKCGVQGCVDQPDPLGGAATRWRSDPGQLHLPWGAINTPIWNALPGMDDPAVVEKLLGHAQTIRGSASRKI
jgi:hypothetical protein